MKDRELLERLERIASPDPARCRGCTFAGECSLRDMEAVTARAAVRRLWECKGQIKHLRRSLKRANQKLDAMQKTIERLREQVDGDSLPPEDVAEILARGCEDW